MNQRIAPVSLPHPLQIARHLGPRRAALEPAFAHVGHIGHEREVGVIRGLEAVGGTAAALVLEILDHPKGERERRHEGFGVVEREVARASLPVDVPDHARHAARPCDGGRAADQMPQLHGDEDGGYSRIVRIEVVTRRNRQRRLVIDAETPFVAVNVARIQIRVGKGVTVGRVLMGIDEARRRDGPAAAIENGGIGIGGPQGLEFRHRADAAIEADVHAVVRPVPFRRQDVGAHDQAGNEPFGRRSRREFAVRGARRYRTRHRAGHGRGAPAQHQRQQAACQTAARGARSGRPVSGGPHRPALHGARRKRRPIGDERAHIRPTSMSIAAWGARFSRKTTDRTPARGIWPKPVPTSGE